MTGRILCILDGMTDEEWKSPPELLPYYRGSFATTPTGFVTESMHCILSLLGLEPKQIPQRGRGWLEAAGCGIPVDSDTLIMRISWVKTDKQGRLATVVTPPCQPVLPGYHSLGGYKGLLCLPGLGSALAGVHTFAPHRHMGQRLEECKALGLPPLLQPFAADRIWMIPWGESVRASLPKIQGPASAVCGIPLVRGIAGEMGMKAACDQSFTGDTDTNLVIKRENALAAARRGSFVLLHINGADEAAHRTSKKQKRKFTGQALTRCVLPLLQSDVQVLVTSDHGTSCSTGRHIESWQPFYTNFDVPGGEGLPAGGAMEMLGIALEK